MLRDTLYANINRADQAVIFIAERRHAQGVTYRKGVSAGVSVGLIV